EFYSCHGAGRLAAHKFKSTSRALVVEQNPTDTVEPIRFTIISGQMKSGHLTDAVRAAWLKRGGLFLRDFVDVTKHLARTREVESTIGPQLTDRCQNIVRAVDIHVHGGKAVSKALRHEALGRKVIALVKIMGAEDVEDTGIALETSRVQRDAVEDVGNAFESGFRGFEGHSPDQAMHLIAQTPEVIGEITAILPGNPSNQRFFCHLILLIRVIGPIGRHDLLRKTTLPNPFVLAKRRGSA